MEKRSTPSARTPRTPAILAGDRVCLYRAAKPLGDALFMTTVAREVRRRKPSLEVSIQTHWPSLFRNNPDVASVTAIRRTQSSGGMAWHTAAATDLTGRAGPAMSMAPISASQLAAPPAARDK